MPESGRYFRLNRAVLILRGWGRRVQGECCGGVWESRTEFDTDETLVSRVECESVIRGTVRTSCLIPLLVCLLTVGNGCRSQPGPFVDDPRLTSNVAMRDVTFHSAALDRDVTYRVILPAHVEAGKRLPVAYLLHGGGADFHSWSNDSDVAHFAEQEFILVMPEGGSSYYVNAARRARDRYEDYIVHDLIADVESRFPASHERQDRAIAGVSMGGFGAITLSLKHPELFIFAAGLSPALDVPSRPFSWHRWGQWRRYREIFGPWNRQYQHDNDPFVLARRVDPAKVPFFFISCGEQEGLLPANRQFAALLAQRHFQYEFHAVPGGHNWNQWNARLGDVFASLNRTREAASESNSAANIAGERAATP